MIIARYNINNINRVGLAKGTMISSSLFSYILSWCQLLLTQLDILYPLTVLIT